MLRRWAGTAVLVACVAAFADAQSRAANDVPVGMQPVIWQAIVNEVNNSPEKRTDDTETMAIIDVLAFSSHLTEPPARAMTIVRQVANKPDDNGTINKNGYQWRGAVFANNFYNLTRSYLETQAKIAKLEAQNRLLQQEQQQTLAQVKLLTERILVLEQHRPKPQAP
jgi:hypothetical protein